MLLPLKSPIVVLSPHTDDWELGAGATILKIIAQGDTPKIPDILFFTFSPCREMIPEGIPKDSTEKESCEVLSAFGLDPATRLKLFDYPVHNFPKYRQSILDQLVRINRALQPGLVFMPNPYDSHQDHATIAQEGWRAFKNTRILCWEQPWNDRDANPNFFVPITETWLRMKLAALGIYKSQRHRPYTDPEFIQGWARMRGVQINDVYAEAFYALRWIS